MGEHMICFVEKYKFNLIMVEIEKEVNEMNICFVRSKNKLSKTFVSMEKKEKNLSKWLSFKNAGFDIGKCILCVT